MQERKALLAVLAHPDDESFGMGGTLALYAQRGVQVHLITATQGEVGEVDPEYLQGFETIGERRVYELQCAAEKLGLAGVYYLGYRDSGMTGSQNNHHPESLAAASIEEVAGKVAQYIRELRPQVVLTFDPIGGYKHPDHIAIHQATVKACDLAADPEFKSSMPPYQIQKLYFHLFPKRYMKIMLFFMRLFGNDPRRYGKNKDIDLVEIAEEGDFPRHAVIDYGDVQEIRVQAAACHESQGGMQVSRGILGLSRRLLGTKDYFMQAYPAPNQSGLQKDLFVDIKQEGSG